MENRVREERRAQHMTLAELSEKSQVGVSTISDIERGVRPYLDTAMLIAKALDTCVERLWSIKKLEDTNKNFGIPEK